MRLNTRFLALGVFIVLLAAVSRGLFITVAQGDSGVVRFIHVVPSVDPIDIYINGQLSVSNLAYGTATGYITAPDGEHTVTVTLHEQAITLWEQTITADADKPATFIASSLEAPQFLLYQDSLLPLELGTARLLIVHALEGESSVDIVVNGDVLISDLGFTQFLGTFDVPTDVYGFSMVSSETDTVILPETPIGLAGGTSQFIIAYGTLDDPQWLVVSAPTTLQGDSGFVRVVHGVTGAPEVDVYIDDTLMIPRLAFGGYSQHLAVFAGDHTLELRATGTTTSLVTSSLSVNSGTAQTVAALGTTDALSLTAFTDEIGTITPTTALLSVLNAIPGETTVSVNLEDGTTLSTDLPSGQLSTITTIAPQIAGITMTLNIDGASPTIDLAPITFYGGVYYNLFAIGGSTPQLIAAPTILVQGVGSGPLGAAVIAQPTATVEVVQVPPTPETQLAAPQPTVAPQPTPVPATPTPSLPTARTILDANANIQLRQYPNSNALSLGLAPANTVFQVNGREGAPVDIDGAEILLPNGQPFVDLAALLPNEQADLDPQNTWLNVIYTTPDGGTIIAWVNAQYLDVTDPDGDPQRLANLPTIPGNEPGEASNTAVTPPPVAENRVTVVVVGLSADVNLNIRRTPDPNGEVLARVPNTTVLEFLGVGASENWVFVRYISAEGAIVTGWVASGFVEFRFRDQRINRQELAEQGLLLPADETTERGEVTQGAVPVVQPTRDPLRDVYVGTVQLDADANLNLRRTPSDQAEVIVPIPSGSQIVVNGRTADNLWLQTTFENQTGWVAAPFVSLSFNGAIVDVTELPILDGGLPASTLAAPTLPAVVPTPTSAS